jgi:xanthine/CO dehydrogenase XdhC/CoxF family maturation factor
MPARRRWSFARIRPIVSSLDLGAITPDEIAVSILAEIVAVRRGRDRVPPE